MMNAYVHERFGSPDVLELRSIPEPEPDDGQVLVRVRAASVNPADWYRLTGRPYVARPSFGLRRPKSARIGGDFAGVVEATGEEVYGVGGGAFGEYVAVSENRIARKPANITFEQAAAVPVAGLTALQALRDKGRLQAGQHVLITGASGGVGTFAVQIAKALGGEVTAVAGGDKVELVRSLGADHVVDYTRQDFTQSGGPYDLMVDIAGSRPYSACRRVLADGATMVIVGGSKRNRLFGPLAHVIRSRLASIGKSQRIAFFVADVNRDDLEYLRELIEAGKVTPVIDSTFALGDLPDAIRHLADGHPRGKIVISVP